MGSSQSFTNPSHTFQNSDNVWAIAQSPNGKFLATGIGRYEIHFFNTKNLSQPLIKLDGCTASILSEGFIPPVFSHNSKLFAYRQGNYVCIMDTETLQIVKKIDNGKTFESISFSHDDRYLAVGHNWWTDAILIYDLLKQNDPLRGGIQGRIMGKPFGCKKMVKVDPIWHPFTNQIIIKQTKQNLINVFEITENDILKICELPHESSVWDVSLSPNGQYLAVGTESNVTIWDWEDKTIINTVVGRSNPGTYSCWNNPNTSWTHDSRFFACADYKTCYIYKISDFSYVTQLTLDSYIHTLSFSPKSTYLNIGYDSGSYVYNRKLNKGQHIELCSSIYFQKINIAWALDEACLYGRWGYETRLWQLKDTNESKYVVSDSELIYEGEEIEEIENDFSQSKIQDPLLETQISFYKA